MDISLLSACVMMSSIRHGQLPIRGGEVRGTGGATGKVAAANTAACPLSGEEVPAANGRE